MFSSDFQKNNIFRFTYEYPVQSDADVFSMRYRETHDIHHMMTGYAIDAFGEIEIQAFSIGNLGLRHARLFVAVGLPWLCLQQRSVSQVISRLRAAYRRGKASRNLLSLPSEELWSTPVSELAARYCPASPQEPLGA